MEAGGVRCVAEAMESVILLVEEEGEERCVFDVTELVVTVTRGG